MGEIAEMARARVRKLLLRLMFTLVLALSGAASADAQSRDLVVQVSTREVIDEPSSEPGSGIVVANDGRTATILTAAHVLTLRGLFSVGNGPLERTTVRFYRDGRTERPAILQYIDTDLDFAILSVPSDQELKDRFEAARDVLMPAGIPVRVGSDQVIILGTRDGVPWSQSERPAPLTALDTSEGSHSIEFDSDITSPGFSGGPLFTVHGALIGMIIEAGLLDKAVDLRTIRTAIQARSLPFDLRENPEVASHIALQILTNALDPTKELQNALTSQQPDFSRLHLYWLANYPATDIARALITTPPGDDRTVVERFFGQTSGTASCRALQRGEISTADFQRRLVAYGLSRHTSSNFSGSCEDNLKLWIRQVVRNGVDPDMRVQTTPNTYNTGLRSLLNVAMRMTNAAATIGLLEAGAAPNPYVDLKGNGAKRVMFVYPLEQALRDFEGSDQDRVWNALIDAGAVIVGNVKNAGTRKYKVANSRTPNRTLCAAIVERQNFDWCGWAEKLTEPVSFRSGTYRIVPVRLITAHGDKAYIFGKAHGGYSGPVDAMLEVSRDYSSITGYWYGNNYGCRPNPENNNKSFPYCWRAYRGSLGSVRASKNASFTPDLSGSTIGNVNIEGLRLSMGLASAHRALISSGFKQRTQGDPFANSYADSVLSITYDQPELSRGAGFKVVNLNAWNGQLIAIDFEHTRSASPQPGWLLPPTGSIANERYRWYRPATEQSKSDARSDLFIIEELQNGFATLVQWHRQDDKELKTLLIRRSSVETDKQRAWFEQKVSDWLRSPREYDTGVCLDDYWRIRNPSGSRCMTRAERGELFMKQNALKANVTQLTPHIQYEILEPGNGRKLRKGDKVRFSYAARELDFVRSDRNHTGGIGSGGRSVKVGELVGAGWYRMALNVLPHMRMGSRFRVYVTPTQEFTPWEDGIVAIDFDLYRFDESKD